MGSGRDAVPKTPQLDYHGDLFVIIPLRQIERRIPQVVWQVHVRSTIHTRQAVI